MLVFYQNVFNDKIDPFRHVNLEKEVISHQFIDNLIDGVVEFIELFKLIVLSFEDIGGFPDVSIFLVFSIFFQVSSLKVLSHEEKQLEEELTDAEILADHLSLEDRFNWIRQQVLY